MITKYTNLVEIPKVSIKNLAEIVRRYNFAKYEKAKDLAELYIKWGDIFKINNLLAWSQAMYETEFLKFNGIVPESANNFAGLGVTGAKDVYYTFETEELGIIAHFAHLAWYCYPDHVNEYCSKKYDPGHTDKKHRFDVFKLEDLGRKWAMSSLTYGQSIADMANQILELRKKYSKSKTKLRIEDYLNWFISRFKKPDWKYIAIHHTVSDQFETTMEMIRGWHKARGFIGEGYNFGINGYGNIEFGRSLNIPGAHVKGWNSVAIGIACYGDFRSDRLTKEQIDRLIELIIPLKAEYNIPTSNILGHCQFEGSKTVCPSKNILNKLDEIKDLSEI